MRKLIPGFLALVLASTLAQAATVTVTPDSGVTDPNVGSALTALEAEIQNNSNLSLLGSQDEFAKGMFEASAFGNNTARISSYQGFTLFALMFGGSVTAVTKDVDGSDAADQIIKDGDAYTGAAAAGAVTLGLNLSPITMLMGLSDSSIYASLKMGGIPEINTDDYKVKGTIFGFGLTYMMIDTFGFVVGEWRGIGINTGFYRISQDAKLKLTYDRVTATSDPATVSFDPEVYLKTKSTVYTVPVEISTAMSLLFFNVSVGGGFDYCFGKGDVSVDVLSDVRSGGTKVGTVAVTDAGVKGEKPTAFNPKVFGGLGLQFSLIKIDIPVAYYPKQKAYTLGASAGVIF